MKWLRVAFLICVITVLQAGMVNAVTVTSLNIKPDLLLVLMVFFATFSTSRDAIITSFAIGFAADVIATGLPMGPRTISFGLIGTVLAHIHSILALRKILPQAVAVFFSSLLAQSVSNLLTSLVSQSAISTSYIAVLGTSLYSSIVSPFLLLPSGWLMRIKTDRPGRN